MLKTVVTNNAIGGLLQKGCKYISKHYHFTFYSVLNVPHAVSV